MMDEYKNGQIDTSITVDTETGSLSRGSLLEEDGRRVEYTMTAKIELTLVGVANDTPETEEKIRKFWSGYVYAIADEANVLLPLDNLNVTEVKIFAREVPV